MIYDLWVTLVIKVWVEKNLIGLVHLWLWVWPTTAFVVNYNEEWRIDLIPRLLWDNRCESNTNKNTKSLGLYAFYSNKTLIKMSIWRKNSWGWRKILPIRVVNLSGFYLLNCQLKWLSTFWWGNKVWISISAQSVATGLKLLFTCRYRCQGWGQQGHRESPITCHLGAYLWQDASLVLS